MFLHDVEEGMGRAAPAEVVVKVGRNVINRVEFASQALSTSPPRFHLSYRRLPENYAENSSINYEMSRYASCSYGHAR